MVTFPRPTLLAEILLVKFRVATSNVTQLISPATSNVLLGLVVPIPNLPSLVNAILSPLEPVFQNLNLFLKVI